MFGFITPAAIPVGSFWKACDGRCASVEVLGVNRYGNKEFDAHIEYGDAHGNVYLKDAFDFQVRYFSPELSPHLDEPAD